MAFSQISAEDVPETVFEDEQSLDDSNSEDGEDIYGYLGAFVVPRVKLEGELRHLSVRINGGNDETSSHDGEFNEPSLMECDNDGMGKCDASRSTSLGDQVQNVEVGDELKDKAPIEMVCKRNHARVNR